MSDFCETSNLGGDRVSKNAPIIHLLGTADELNSYLGLIKVMLSDENCRQFLEEIQKNLMKLMAYVSNFKDDKYLPSNDDIETLERETKRLSEKLPEQSKFVIPGKSIIEAQIHIARTAARRTERLFAAADEEKPLNPKAGVYLNRLSDYLFILSQQEF